MASDKIVSSHQTKDLRIVLSQEITYPLFKNFTTLETKRIKDAHFENVHQHRAYCRENEKNITKEFFCPQSEYKIPSQETNDLPRKNCFPSRFKISKPQ